jgi:diguanylate cyclase (GGDEF)-like protein/PAS domain S-box-containing protein
LGEIFYIVGGAKMSNSKDEITRLDLIKDEEFYSSLKQQIKLPLIAWNQNYNIQDWNQEAVELLGWRKEEVINKNFFDICVAEENEQIVKSQLKKIMRDKSVPRESIRLETKSGNQIITKWNNTTIFNNQQSLEVVSIIQNITEAKQREEKIKYFNFHDNLTGLYNREYFQEELKRLNVERQLPLSILVGDVNGLKLVNDAFGYKQGNQLLRTMASIFKKVCRNEDIIARIGGDEFAFLFPNNTKEDVQKIKGRIEAECKKHLADPIIPSIALGYATKNNSEQDINEVLTLAEDRMYKHKLIESNSFRNSIISSLEKSLLEKSDETENHNSRMKNLALKLGEELDLDTEKLDELEILARLHDIGKIAIPDSILKKPGSLTDEEWSKMKEHPEIGYRIAEASKELATIADKILSHHERWDGSGYPNGLSGSDIPLLARIASVVDAYDAMTNDRVYRSAIPKEEAKQELISCAGTQFDPQIVDVFINQTLEKAEVG